MLLYEEERRGREERKRGKGVGREEGGREEGGKEGGGEKKETVLHSSVHITQIKHNP